jgi:hypothetical protein
MVCMAAKSFPMPMIVTGAYISCPHFYFDSITLSMLQNTHKIYPFKCKGSEDYSKAVNLRLTMFSASLHI